MYNQDPCPSVSENAVFRKCAEFQYNFHLRSLIAPRSREESRSTRRDMQSAPVEAAVPALDDGLRLLCAACACLQGGRCALLSVPHRPGPMSPWAVKRTGSCCASPSAGGAARRRSVRQRGGDAQTHDGCVQALLLATGAAAHCPFTVMVRSHLVGQPCKGGHRALASETRDFWDSRSPLNQAFSGTVVGLSVSESAGFRREYSSHACALARVP